MEKYRDILFDVRDAVARITINRPEKYNAFTAETCEELIDAFRRAGWDRSVAVIVLTGAGDRAFAAGADIRELDSVRGGEGKAFSLRGQAVFRKIETLGKPVIACVRGFALGGGCELALACSIRLASSVCISAGFRWAA